MRRFVSIVAAIAVAAAVAACAASTSTVPAHAAGFKTGGTLTVGLVGDITYADPMFANDVSSTYVENQVVEGLVGLRPGSSSVVVPVLASALPTVSADGLTYTFKLRSGIKFHDGTNLDAAAVKSNYDRWNTLPKGDLQNAAQDFKSVFGGFGDASNLASVTAADSQTVVIALRKPQSNFLITQANVAFGIQSPEALKDNDATNATLAKNPYALGTGGKGKAMVGTGPFVFSERVAGDHVTLTKNADYWNKTDAAYVDRIVFKPFADAVTAGKALTSGSVDMLDLVDPATLKSIKGSTSVSILDRGQSCNVTQLAMYNANTLQSGATNVLADDNVRMAIAWAVDKQALVNDTYGGAAIVADNWAPPGSLDYKREYLPGFDVNKARGFMALAGRATTKTAVDLWYPTGGPWASLIDVKGFATTVAANLSGIGITATLKTEAAANFNADSAAGKFQMWLSSQDCVWDSVDYFINTAFFHYVAGTPSPQFAYTNDTLAATMTSALAALDAASAKSGWQQAEDLLPVDMPTLPLVHAKLPGAARSYVHGVIASGSMVEILSSVWLDK